MKCSSDTALRDFGDLVTKGIPARADTGGRGAHYLLKKIDAGSCIEVILACVPKKSGVWNPKNGKNLIALQKTMCIFGVNSND